MYTENSNRCRVPRCHLSEQNWNKYISTGCFFGIGLLNLNVGDQIQVFGLYSADLGVLVIRAIPVKRETTSLLLFCKIVLRLVVVLHLHISNTLPDLLLDKSTPSPTCRSIQRVWCCENTCLVLDYRTKI